MNDKSRHTIMAIAGGYIAYTGISLISDVIQGKPKNGMLMILIGIAFIVIGIYIVIIRAKDAMKAGAEQDTGYEESTTDEEYNEEMVEELAIEVLDNTEEVQVEILVNDKEN